MAGEANDDRQVKICERATALVTEALDLLDAHGSSPEAAAHLAMAQQKLREAAGKLR
jgi:hypothetical protein